MKISIRELRKILDFIIINRNIALDSELFNRETLINIRNITVGNKQNDFRLSEEQKKALIEAFLASDFAFDKNTPKIIIDDSSCIIAAIRRDVKSIDFIPNFTKDLTELVTQTVLDSDYVINEKSPIFVKNNFAIVLKSINLNVNSANYMAWSRFTSNQKEQITAAIIKGKYRLTSKSPLFLTGNIPVVLSSLDLDSKTSTHIARDVRRKPEVFKALLLHDCYVNSRELDSQKVDLFADKKIMRGALNSSILMYEGDMDEDIQKDEALKEKYCDRYAELFSYALSTPPTIAGFLPMFRYYGNLSWEDYRKEHLSEYNNLFGKICTELQNNSDFEEARGVLRFLYSMARTLDDKFDELLNAMKNFHKGFHEGKSIDELAPYRDIISKMCARYISMVKDEHINNFIRDGIQCMKELFKPKIVNPQIHKKAIELTQRSKFEDLYDEDDQETMDFLHAIEDKYEDQLEDIDLAGVIGDFIYSYDIEDSFYEPDHYNEYVRFEEAQKLVNRLNSHYIQYTDAELTNYRDIIAYSQESQRYVYMGKDFSQDYVEEVAKFRKEKRIVYQAIKEIMMRIKNIEVTEEEYKERLVEAADEFPLTDEYFEFNPEIIQDFDFETLISAVIGNTENFIEPASLLDDKTFEYVKEFITKNNLVWLLLNKYVNHDRFLREVNRHFLSETLSKFKDVSGFIKQNGLRNDGFGDIVNLCKILKYADQKSIAILGPEIVTKLWKERGYISLENEEVVENAKELVSRMIQRTTSTVPYVKGKTINYQYSIYDPLDVNILLTGINTDSCFRVGGNDNDFLHYCALNKNGFVVRLADAFGNFIGKASGFRNGNSVYINQLRTVYDRGGGHYSGLTRHEKDEIALALRACAQDIIKASAENKKETNKIKHVFTTDSYTLSDTSIPEIYRVSTEVEDVITGDPMDMESNDWFEFVDNTPNLDTCDRNCSFDTDFSNYHLLCLASTKKSHVTPRDIRKFPVEPVYTRKRNCIKIANNVTPEVYNHINRINGLQAHLYNQEYKNLQIPSGASVFFGDNWYLVYKDGKVIASLVLEFDARAQLEYSAARFTIKNRPAAVSYTNVQKRLELLRQKSNIHYKYKKVAV